MPSKREIAIVALTAALQAGLASRGATVGRAIEEPEVLPVGGLVRLVEGEALIETMLSPLTYMVQQPVTLIVAAVAIDETDRDATLDDLLTAISELLTGDRTLGGAIDWLEIGAANFGVFEGDGAAKEATLAVTLHFDTADSPLA